MSAPNVYQVGKASDLERMIAYAVTSGFSHHAQIIRAVRAGRLNMVQLERQAPAPMGVLKRSPRPTLILLGDDDGRATGPAGWAAAPRLLRWVNRGMIHATGADVASYKLAVDMTVRCGRFLMVETGTAHLDAWSGAFLDAGVPFLALRPRSGCHPLTPAPDGVMQ